MQHISYKIDEIRRASNKLYETFCLSMTAIVKMHLPFYGNTTTRLLFYED